MLCKICGFVIGSHPDVEIMVCENRTCMAEGCDNCIKPSHFWEGHVCSECEDFAKEQWVVDKYVTKSKQPLTSLVRGVKIKSR